MDKSHTLQGINISHLGKRKIIFKMPFLGDMLVPWRVSFLTVYSQVCRVTVSCFEVFDAFPQQATAVQGPQPFFPSEKINRGHYIYYQPKQIWRIIRELHCWSPQKTIILMNSQKQPLFWVCLCLSFFFKPQRLFIKAFQKKTKNICTPAIQRFSCESPTSWQNPPERVHTKVKVDGTVTLYWFI